MPARPTAFRAALVAALLACAAPAAAQAPDSLPLSLADAVARAQSGEEVTLAARRRDAAAALVGSARSAGLPQLRFNGTFNHVYENARGQAVGQIFNQPNTVNAAFGLSVPLFQGGRVMEATRAASRHREAATAELEDTRAEVSLLALRAYLGALLADRLVAIQERNLVLAEERLRQVEQFAAGGRSSRYDVLRARVERSNLRPALIQSRGERDLALLELRRLTDVPEGRPVRLTSAVDTAQVRALADDLAGQAAADSAALEELPSVRAARLRASAGRATMRAARAGYLPTVALNVNSGWQAFPPEARLPFRRGELETVDCPPGSSSTRCTRQNGGWFSDRSAGLTVSWPLFDGLRTRSDVQVARANAQVSTALASQAWEEAHVAAGRARTALESARALFAASRENVAEADEAFRLATLRFGRGLGTQLEVSDAQLALLTARVNEARATHELYLAAAELSRALGRPIPLPGAPATPTDRTDAR